MALWTNIDETAGKPKNLSTTEKNATVGIDATEASTNGLTAGWNLKTTGSGGRSGRVFHEVLVAMGSMTGDNDTVDPDPVITIGTQPANDTVADGETAEFTVAATATRGAALSYLWQVSTDSGANWVDLTAVTTNTLTLPGIVLADDGNQYRVTVSATGATPVTSSVATLTVTA